MTKRRPASGGAGTPATLSTAKAAGLARQQELEAVRVSAGKWQAGLAGLLALVTGVAGFGLRDQLHALDTAYAIAVGALLSVSLGCALAALLFALHASGGLPRLVKTKSASPDLAHRDAKTAADRLRFAIVLAIASLALFTAANWTHGMAPRQATASATITSATNAACGATEIIGDYVLVTTKQGEVTLFRIGSVTKWEPADCP